MYFYVKNKSFKSTLLGHIQIKENYKKGSKRVKNTFIVWREAGFGMGRPAIWLNGVIVQALTFMWGDGSVQACYNV